MDEVLQVVVGIFILCAIGTALGFLGDPPSGKAALVRLCLPLASIGLGFFGLASALIGGVFFCLTVPASVVNGYRAWRLAKDRCAAGIAFVCSVLLATALMAGVYLFAVPFNRTPAAHNVCIANLKQLEGAKATWAIEFNKTTNDIPSDREIFGPTNYIRYKMLCPKGGHYLIGRVGQKPRCSVAGHDLDRGAFAVFDEAGAPLAGVEIRGDAEWSNGRTDHLGQARIPIVAGSSVEVSAMGFVAQSLPFPKDWPARIVLKRSDGKVAARGD